MEVEPRKRELDHVVVDQGRFNMEKLKSLHQGEPGKLPKTSCMGSGAVPGCAPSCELGVPGVFPTAIFQLGLLKVDECRYSR